MGPWFLDRVTYKAKYLREEIPCKSHKKCFKNMNKLMILYFYGGLKVSLKKLPTVFTEQ